MDALAIAKQKAHDGVRLSFEEALLLYENASLLDLAQWARQAKERHSKKNVYYNINRHINLSNTCTANCPLCAFSVEAGDKNGYLMSLDDIATAVKNAQKNAPGLTEIHIVSSLYPNINFSYYLDVIKLVKNLLPTVHIQAFTPVEIVYFAQISHKSIKAVLEELKAAGLSSLPGGGAEILDDKIRKIICPDKASTAEWVEVVTTAHKLNIPTNASILYGHIETLPQRLRHLFTLRDIQDKTNGFNAFVSFPFHPLHTQLAAEYIIKPTTAWENLKFIAIARLVLDNIDHIKAFWIMLSEEIAQLALAFGADDLDGTVGKEKIIHAAGADSGSLMSTSRLAKIITQAGYLPVERNSLYQPLSNKESINE
ncbi:radical SAM protein [Pectinatus brassicae]|uniref:Aminodeoxyfutalosine synthase n=1 Tax=Pectinatus brassicae TaxID=862415 RepID=A0A840ULY7_9FIRM|nr:CofH family radical SAM protein [Pectinatus brassicae]MBB5335262.1 aminodeoxyfutalosine synthase [Pectinatus brassicae]